MNSITLNDTGSTANNWYQYSIGTETNSYKGIFDGGNFTISNLYIEGAENAGFFGVTEGATIKNLTIADAKVVSTIADTTANKYTGVLTAVAENATIENVTLSGQMSPKSGSHYMLCAGSVAGVTKGQTSIKKCTSTVSITATDYSSTVGTIKAGYGIGGLVGFAFNGDTNLKTTIEGCTYDGKINTPYNYMVGGIVGHLNQHHTVVINKTTVSGTLTAYVKGTTTSEAILGHKSSSSSHSKLTLGTGENANTVTITTAYTSN